MKHLLNSLWLMLALGVLSLVCFGVARLPIRVSDRMKTWVFWFGLIAASLLFVWWSAGSYEPYSDGSRYRRR